MTKPTYYITTAIPYVNASPHIGFALETLQADVLARHQRLRGKQVRFLSGTDDNSLKNALAARALDIPVEQLVERNAKRFLELRECLNLSYDDFIQTSSDPRHRPAVLELWRRCNSAGDIYVDTYDGLYCVGCESFVRAIDLEDGFCAEHLEKPKRVREQNYFFRLSKYAERLNEEIKSRRFCIRPTRVREQVLELLRGELPDISISRSRERAAGWGIAVPDDPEQIIYVWFDALANYISALGFGSSNQQYKAFWQRGDRKTHLVGKGITRFHAVYWPAILLSAGLPLPDELLVHGYLTENGEKISKSRGNAVSPQTLVEQYGVDSLRHYLLAHIRSTADGDVSRDVLEAAHNSELADQLGNLLSRVVTLVARYQGGIVSVTDSGPNEARLVEIARGLPACVNAHCEAFALHEACKAIWTLVSTTNRYITDVEPWKRAKQGAWDEVAVALYHCAESLRLIAVHLAPFIPNAAAEILRRLGGLPLCESALQWRAADSLWSTRHVVRAAPLFPKITRNA